MKKKSCRPVSRILSPVRRRTLYHLSSPVLAGGIHLPTPRHRASNPQAPVCVAFQPTGFTPWRCCQRQACALTARFHLYHAPKRKRGSLVFCGTFRTPAAAGAPPVRWCGALRCPDFPLLRTCGAAIERPATSGKVTQKLTYRVPGAFKCQRRVDFFRKGQ